MYKFLDFKLDTNTHDLFKGDNRLELSANAYNLLLYFIKNPNKTLTKDTIINHVWKEKPITEATLYKQVQRLRNVLGDIGAHKSIITTIHGVGFEFIPEIILFEKGQSTLITNKLKYLGFIPVLFVLSYFLISSVIEENSLPVESQSIVRQFTLAIIPENDNNKSWMTSGGVHYLAETFAEPHSTIRRYSNKDIKGNSTKFAIDLYDTKLIDNTLVIDTREINSKFIADASLRNKHGIIAERQFKSIALKTLLDKVSNWTKQKLNIKNPQKSQVMSKSRFAVENYIRGMASSAVGDESQAIKYFEIATHEDSKFWLAWYELTISYRKQGNLERALALLNTLNQINVSQKEEVMILASKGNILYRLGRHEKAMEVNNLGILTAKKLNNLKYLSVFLTNKSIVASEIGKFELAEQNIKKSINIIKQRKNNNFSSLGSAYNTLSGILIKRNKFQQAEVNSKLAIENFKLANNKRYETTAQSRFSYILIKLGNTNQAKIISLKTYHTRKAWDDKIGQVSSLLQLIRISIINGDFSQANSYVDLAIPLVEKSNNKFQKFGVYVIRLELALLKKNFNLAENTINLLEQNIYNNEQKIQLIALKLKYFKSIENKVKWTDVANELINDKNLINHPLVYNTKAKIAIANNSEDNAKQEFIFAKKLYFQSNDVIGINKYANDYIDFLFEHNKISSVRLLMGELSRFALPVYPIEKAKAKLAFAQGNIILAASTLKECQLKSGDYWNSEDQLLLEKYQRLLK